MARMIMLFLFIPRLHCHSNHSVNVSMCWSAWSPCTVTCVPFTPEAIEADFARRWRVWLHKRCPKVPPPNQLTQFKKCSASEALRTCASPIDLVKDFYSVHRSKVPPCLELESILRPSPRTVYRLWALVMLMLLSLVPSLYICCKYTTGFPVIRWEQNQKSSLRTSMLDAMLMTEQLEKSVPDESKSTSSK